MQAYNAMLVILADNVCWWVTQGVGSSFRTSLPWTRKLSPHRDVPI